MIHSPYQRARVSKTKRPPFKVKPQLLLGVALLLIGSAVFLYGTKSSVDAGQSAGSFHQFAVSCMIGGGLTGLVGVFLTLLNLLKNRV